MIVSLYLRCFRSYAEAYVQFSPGINLIYGENAEGKTNLLEAVFLLSTGKSFRTNQLSDLIAHGCSSFYLEAEILRSGISQRIRLSFTEKKRQLQIDATTYSTFTPLLGMLPHVIYTPSDIDFIHGPPAERRRFLDLHLAQSDPLYVHHWVRYDRAMKQRNHLLRKSQEETLESWEEIMAQSGAYLMIQRKKLIAELQPHLSQAMQTLSETKEQLNMDYRYIGSFPLDDQISAHLKERFFRLRRKEQDLGFTLIGPHRDDLDLLINNQTVKSFGSEGQKRCCMTAIRLAEWNRLEEQTKAPPLFGIDDVGMHLDTTRSVALEQRLSQLGQVFLTSPSLPSLNLSNRSLASFHISNGAISAN